MLRDHRASEVAELGGPSDWRATRDSLATEWTQLLDEYFPCGESGAPWRFAPGRYSLPSQGWKLHISATVLTAGQVLKRIASVMNEWGIAFKVPASLEHLQVLNSGMRGYSQIGKCITIYAPQDGVGDLARGLDQLLADCDGPRVPFDGRLRPGGVVHYRYGVFLGSTSEGETPPSLITPSGSVTPDDRYGSPYPAWCADVPFDPEPDSSPPDFFQEVLCYRILSRRGRGSVCAGVDLRSGRGRPCVVKQGLRHGETDWAGIDGSDRIQREAEALAALSAVGVPVPSFDSLENIGANRYLVMEDLPGASFDSLLSREAKLPSLRAALELCMAVAHGVAAVHQAGWVWGDCKPRNLILDDQQNVCLLDFEGASRLPGEDIPPWATPMCCPRRTRMVRRR